MLQEAPPAGELNSVTTLPHGLGAGVELGSQTRHAAMGLNVRASDRVVSDELITERKCAHATTPPMNCFRVSVDRRPSSFG